MSHGDRLNADWQPSTARLDLAYGDENPVPVWGDTAARLTEEPGRFDGAHLVRVVDGFGGWRWQCIDCASIGRGFPSELDAVEAADQHGYVDGAWA